MGDQQIPNTSTATTHENASKSDAKPSGDTENAAKETKIAPEKCCKDFLELIITQAAKRSEQAVATVKNRIQDMIDNKIDPETFVREISKDFDFFGKYSQRASDMLTVQLPDMRKAMRKGKLSIDGVVPPPSNTDTSSNIPRGSIGKSNSSTQTSYEPKCAPYLKVAMSSIETKIQDENEILKNQLKSMMESFNDLKTFVMSQNQEKPKIGQETGSNKENSDNKIVHEFEQPVSKKIKLEKVEDYVEEIQRLNEDLKNLKEENVMLSKKNADLESKLSYYE